MVKVIDISHDRREKRYFKAKCPFCDSILAFEYGDIWWSEPSEVIGQVPCPICRTKFFINGLDFPSFLVTAEPISEDEWEAARTDVSKRGIEELMMMAKAARETDAASSVDPEEYRDFIAEKPKPEYSFGKMSTNDGPKDAIKLRHPFGNENI